MTHTLIYVPVPVSDLPEKDGFYFTLSGDKTGNNWFQYGKWLDEAMSGRPTEVTHWLRPTTAYVLSKEDIEKLVSDAWEAAEAHVDYKEFGGPFTPDKQQYINSILK